jgi:predicted acylesterase/phospholipase RssA
MKGGVTSGVVYPLAIVELAKRYRFRNIGGASAGAIAAAATAAAELARQAGRRGERVGFEGLALLPADLSASVNAGPSRLQSLFQPTRATRALFDILLAALSTKGARRWVTVVGTALRRLPVFPLAGAILAALLVWIAVRDFSGSTAGVVQTVLLGLAALLSIGAGMLGLVLQGAVRAGRVIPAQGYGLCPGFDAGNPRAAVPPLCTWIADLLDGLGGLAGREQPLTLGELEAHGIEAVVMTTNLTHGRPCRLPFIRALEDDFFFREDEFAGLFPDRVVSFMKDAALKRLAEYPSTVRAQHEAYAKQSFYAFPRKAELPLVVAVRMSLSFPVLLSAVPLWTSDTSLPENHLPGVLPRLERCWFSDGGICSNLPIHFFDALLPRRPTFALDLRGESAAQPVRLDNESKNVWLPENNHEGIEEDWNRFDAKRSLASFLSAIVQTMQGWVDNTQLRVPGYRDRVAHIFHRADEGGLNLNMNPAVIDRLSRRGAAAGTLLREQFNWGNHLWVRYRSILGLFQGAIDKLRTGYVENEAGKSSLEALLASPPSYPMSPEQKTRAAQANEGAIMLAESWKTSPGSLEEGLPLPVPDLRVRPKA